MINQLVLTGNLGADVEVFYTSDGDPVSKFNLAFKSGREKTSWIKCVCFNKNAESGRKVSPFRRSYRCRWISAAIESGKPMKGRTAAAMK